MPESFLADAVLLNSEGREVARLEGLELSQQNAQALTQAVQQRWGQEVWLLHDGGLELRRRGVPARFEVQAEGGALLPDLPNARPWQRPGWRT
ncbi:hypothetical protein MF271_03950 [Deinococcus sp. KNUC1210]|uniref:hypothetical protein n=1 Tax=Deinococcus sp. KNUC1210 TaxID=2917691 RepID=UPI001EF09020|nr:hypothetical protein [Deinococcus sp. KNUC1210]ULH15800.1 hypothetical protein MF271_03950 [Deinococcus sp. KNUC1210]